MVRALPLSRDHATARFGRRLMLAILAGTLVGGMPACGGPGVVSVSVGESAEVTHRVPGGLAQRVRLEVTATQEVYELRVRSTLVNGGRRSARVIAAPCLLSVESEIPLIFEDPLMGCIGLPRQVDLAPGATEVMERLARVPRAAVRGEHELRVQHLYEPSVTVRIRFDAR